MFNQCLGISFFSGNDSTYENGTVINCCTGLSIDLLRIISDRMKFDFNLFEVPDQTFGIQDEVINQESGYVLIERKLSFFKLVLAI